MKYVFTILGFLISLQLVMGQDYSKWQYQQLLTVDNSANASPLIDYQVCFTLNTQKLINSGKMKADGSDVRLVSLDGHTSICHWIEGDLGGKNTKIWLKIDRLEVKSFQQIYLLYGNPEAQAIADPNCVFDLFEGFNQAKLDEKKWDSIGNGKVQVGNGVAKITAEDTDQLISTKEVFSMPVIAEAFVKKAAGKRITLALIQNDDHLWSGYAMSWEDKYREMYLNATDSETSPCGGFSFFKDLFGSKAPNPIGQWSISWITKNQVFAQWPNGSINQGNTIDHFKPLKVVLGVNACSANLNYKGEMVIDWVRIRKLAMNEPKVYLQGSEKNQISSVDSPVQLMG